MLTLINSIYWIYQFSSFIFFFIPICVFLVAGLRLGALTWSSPQVKRKTIIWLELITVGFVGLDTLMLSLLPVLRLSYGQIQVPLFVMALFRVLTGLVWGMVYIYRGNSNTMVKKNTWFWFYLIFHIALSLLVVDGFFIEPFNIQVRSYQAVVPGAAPGESLRIVQLSDLHVERWGKREEAILAELQELKPDLILLTGDYLNSSNLNDAASIEDLRTLLKNLSAPYGVFAVDGTVEDPIRLAERTVGTGIIVLNDETYHLDTKVGPIDLLGVSDYDEPRDEDVLNTLAAEGSSGVYQVVMYHTPDLIEIAAEDGANLYLAGHTHGGQICLPFYGALVTSSKFGKKYEGGLYQVGELTAIVSRGIGLEGTVAPRARLFCPPEIVVVDLVGVE